MTVSILGISGSLRTGSYNTALLRAAVDLAPADMVLSRRTLHDIPLYNEDVYRQGFPEAVLEFRTAIADADGLLVATPEYNYSVPGVLKNAIDWASRPPDQPFANKPIAIMGASPGGFGTVRSQLALRPVFGTLKGLCMVKPEMHIAKAGSLFDDDGVLTDQDTRERLASFLGAFADWVRVVGGVER